MKDGSFIPVKAVDKVVIDLASRRKPSAEGKHDCQRESPRAVLMDDLRTIKSGLMSGMSPTEIREFEVARCQAMIANQVELLWHYASKDRAIAHLRALADKLETR